MLICIKGAGVSTQIKMLCEKFKIDSLDLMPEYLAAMESELNKRKRGRLLARGFRPIPESDDPEVPAVDPEIEEDPEDFDKTEHERELLRMVLASNRSLVYDGNWTSLPEDKVS